MLSETGDELCWFGRDLLYEEKRQKWEAGGNVTLMRDNDPGGENGAKQALYELAQHVRVRLAWSASMLDGGFRGRQPEAITEDEWAIIRANVVA